MTIEPKLPGRALSRGVPFKPVTTSDTEQQDLQ
jgi:hypothetical protein